VNPAENYILNQPEPFRSILLHLQVVITHAVPEVDLKYKYKIPFYYIDGKPFCFTAVQLKKGYVDVGFWVSAHLTKHLEHMITEKRKVLRSLRYYTLEEIDDSILIAVLQDAYSVRDKGFWKS